MVQNYINILPLCCHEFFFSFFSSPLHIRSLSKIKWKIPYKISLSPLLFALLLWILLFSWTVSQRNIGTQQTVSICTRKHQFYLNTCLSWPSHPCQPLSLATPPSPSAPQHYRLCCAGMLPKVFFDSSTKPDNQGMSVISMPVGSLLTCTSVGSCTTWVVRLAGSEIGRSSIRECILECSGLVTLINRSLHSLPLVALVARRRPREHSPRLAVSLRATLTHTHTD